MTYLKCDLCHLTRRQYFRVKISGYLQLHVGYNLWSSALRSGHPQNPRGFRGSIENLGYRTAAARNLETGSRKSSRNCGCDEILIVIGRYFQELCRLDFSNIHGFMVPPNQIATLGTLAELKLKLNWCILWRLKSSTKLAINPHAIKGLGSAQWSSSKFQDMFTRTCIVWPRIRPNRALGKFPDIA